MRVRTLAFMYWRRVRAQPMQELLALAGIASGVALVFAVQVANTSVTGSVEQLSHGITGRASLEVAARSSTGFDQRLLFQVKSLPGVRSAAPLLERQVIIAHGGRRRGITLVGGDQRVAALGGSLLRRFREADPVYRGIAITQTMAANLGVDAGSYLDIYSGTNATRSRVGFILTPPDVGPLAKSALGVAPLARVQKLVGSRGRISRILVEPLPGRQRAVESELSQRFGDRLNVRPSDSEARLLKQAAGPSDQATALFSAVSAIIGMLFAYCAMLLTVAARRRDLEVLRLDGASDRKILSGIIFDALVLGVVASFAGLLAGDQLSRHVFHTLPGYLAFAFPTGEQRVVEPETVALAFGGGIVATLLAATRPGLELLSGDGHISRERGGRAADALLTSLQPLGGWLGALIIAVAALVAFLIPATSMIGVGMAAIGMILALPPLLQRALQLVDRLTFFLRKSGGLLAVSVSELRFNATRTAALAATGAVAVFGIASIQGARNDLVNGHASFARKFFGTGDLWITSARDHNTLTSDPFDRRPVDKRLAHIRAVARTREFHGEIFDFHNRRVWVVARPRGESTLITKDEIVEGNVKTAMARMRSTGWAAVSAALAKDQHAQVGDRLTVDIPSGRRNFRVAALITNLGWAPGSIVLNSADYRDDWRSRQPSALELDLAPGVTPRDGARDVRQALAPFPGLRVETSNQISDRMSLEARRGLTRLGQIATLVLISAALAVAAAMGAAMWQRRPTLAMLKATGLYERRLWRALLIETGLVLAFGGFIGAALGILGQLMLTRWVGLTTGYPTHFSPDLALAVGTIGLLSAIALAIAAIPGYFAARVSPAAQFQE